MSELTKLIYAFVGIMIVGFGIVYFSKETEQDKVGQALLMSGNMLNTYARESCTQAGEAKAGTHLYMPSESQSDGNSYVSLTWNYTNNGDHVLTCRYERDKGITEMTLDGAPIGNVSVDRGADAPSRAAGAANGKHDAGH
ncbi:hypothetical protein [Methylococcus capsulatus]|uniref:hypothetical protein n=1 Tax=Methylococcus capsulatus TaxID=414 RepID=UPI002FDB684C